MFRELPFFDRQPVKVILELRSNVIARDLASMEREGWDADLSDPEIIMFRYYEDEK